MARENSGMAQGSVNVISALVRRLKKAVGLCPFHNICRYYDLDGVVCNEEGGGPYCGEYRRLSVKRRTES